MLDHTLVDLKLLAPEAVLIATALALLILSTFGREGRGARMAGTLALAASLGGIAVAAVLSIAAYGGAPADGDMLAPDSYALFFRIVLLTLVAIALIFYYIDLRGAGAGKSDLLALVLLSAVGLLLMVSSNSLLIIYLGLEISSLPLYILIAAQRRNVAALEASVKYFILGAFASGILLYGVSLLYGAYGGLDITQMSVTSIDAGAGVPFLVLFGALLALCGLAFKVSAAPFHMWTPDVYEGAPTPVVALLSSASKVAAFAVVVRICLAVFPVEPGAAGALILASSVLSMLWGAFGALWQTNLKRLLAYSAIGQIGYALIGVGIGGEAGATAAIAYVSIYGFTSVAAFGCIACLHRDNRNQEALDSVAGLARRNPGLAIVFSVLMLSLAGIPPFAGFFAKFYVFLAAIREGYYAVAVVGVLSSVISAYYYVKVVKVMWLNDPTTDKPFVVAPLSRAILYTVAIVTSIFFVRPDFLFLPVATAVASVAKVTL